MPSSKPAARLFTRINATANASQQTRSKVGHKSSKVLRHTQNSTTRSQKINPDWLLKSNYLLDMVGVAPHTPRCRPRSSKVHHQGPHQGPEHNETHYRQ